jgi:hypothetical protein
MNVGISYDGLGWLAAMMANPMFYMDWIRLV